MLYTKNFRVFHPNNEKVNAGEWHLLPASETIFYMEPAKWYQFDRAECLKFARIARFNMADKFMLYPQKDRNKIKRHQSIKEVALGVRCIEPVSTGSNSMDMSEDDSSCTDLVSQSSFITFKNDYREESDSISRQVGNILSNLVDTIKQLDRAISTNSQKNQLVQLQNQITNTVVATENNEIVTKHPEALKSLNIADIKKNTFLYKF